MPSTPDDALEPSATSRTSSAFADNLGPLLHERVLASAQPILLQMLGPSLSAEELAYWASLTPVKRAAAAKRLEALRDWMQSKGSMSVADAAKAAGTSASRFYRLISDWGRRESLASLGVLATVDRSGAARISQDVNAILLREAHRAVTELDKSSVRAQVVRLREMAGPLVAAMPGESKLRQYVEQARHRKQDRAGVGNYIVYDCAACTLHRPDGRPWVLFALIDRISGVILGFQLGETVQSARAFALVATDALVRLSTPWGRGLPWSAACAEIDAVVGGDADRGDDLENWHRLTSASAGTGAGVKLGLVTNKRRHGYYFRKIVGPTIGKLGLSSAAKADHKVIDTERERSVEAAEALMVIEGEVARYNAAALAEHFGGPLSSPVPPPGNLVGLLSDLVREAPTILK